jgi:hypothetical protein
MNKFIFKSYEYNNELRQASFRYAFDDGAEFEEKVQFESSGVYDEALLDKAMFLSFILIGISYYKSAPSVEVAIETSSLDSWQADFFSKVYQEGLSQFAFENKLTRNDLAHFQATTDHNASPLSYVGQSTLALQSGGKDSLLTAMLLAKAGQSFVPWYLAYSPQHPGLLDTLGAPLSIATRQIDKDNLNNHRGRNGHVPITYIVMSYALINAILNNLESILISVGHEGEEPHHWIGDLPVNHQWSKTWHAERLFVEYVHRYITPDIRIGSPLRIYSELKVAELFVEHAWTKYGHSFSSCNQANYKQGTDNTELKWCGECPKCANSFLLFAPFLPADELKSIYNGQDLFEKPHLQNTFKGLLGIGGVMKPLECVGETEELRLAYHKAQARGGYGVLSFTVPDSLFDYQNEYDGQTWARQMIQ